MKTFKEKDRTREEKRAKEKTFFLCVEIFGGDLVVVPPLPFFFFSWRLFCYASHQVDFFFLSLQKPKPKPKKKIQKRRSTNKKKKNPSLKLNDFLACTWSNYISSFFFFVSCRISVLCFENFFFVFLPPSFPIKLSKKQNTRWTSTRRQKKEEGKFLRLWTNLNTPAGIHSFFLLLIKKIIFTLFLFFFFWGNYFSFFSFFFSFLKSRNINSFFFSFFSQ